MSLNMKTVILGDFNLNSFTSKDIDDIEQLLQLTQLICNKHAPLRDIKGCNPWISKEIFYS